MKALLLTPIVLSLVVLAAHFLRGGSIVLVVAILALVALLPLRRRWIARLVQAVLFLGAAEWARTTTLLAISRSEQGEPFLRMVVILGAVTIVTLASGLLFQSATLQKFYGLRRDSA